VSAMAGSFFRLVELVFTAYAVPGLIIPFVWIARRLLSPPVSRSPETTARLRGAVALYGALSAVWVGVWFALGIGVPIERAGKTAGVLLWVAYGLLNVALATLLVRFTAGYGGLPDGRSKDRLFLYFLSAIVAQPFATACAFAVLYRVMGVVYHLHVPGLGPVQEGI
jgi:hypothetical protein